MNAQVLTINHLIKTLKNNQMLEINETVAMRSEWKTTSPKDWMCPDEETSVLSVLNYWRVIMFSAMSDLEIVDLLAETEGIDKEAAETFFIKNQEAFQLSGAGIAESEQGTIAEKCCGCEFAITCGQIKMLLESATKH